METCLSCSPIIGGWGAILAFLCLLARNKNIDTTLTPVESILAARIDFDEEVLRLVKGVFGKDIEPNIDFVWPDGSEKLSPADFETDGKGFIVRLADAEDDTWHLDELYKVRSVLPDGYLAFSTEDWNHRPCVVILKTSDPYEIIRNQETRGWDFEDRFYGSEDIIQVLMEWQKRCRMDLIGAGSSNVKLILRTLPDDLVGFAEEVNYLCWELDQINGFSYIGDGIEEAHIVAEKLAASLRETRRLYLWWD